jgi:hypothetical protein
VEPSYRRTLKEAMVALLLWLGAGIWVISVSYWLGYKRPVHSVAGIPNWVVWGVLLPWVTLFILHTWYSLWFLRADDRGDDSKNSQPSQPTPRGPGG